MSEQIRSIVNCVIAFCWACITCLMTFAVSMADILFFQTKSFTEFGLVELTQEIVLFAAAVIYGYLGIQSSNKFYVLTSGLLFCMAIRECDAFIDLIGHGYWFYIDLAVAGIFIYMGLRSGVRKVCEEIYCGMCSRSFYWLFTGLLVVLLFSRLFGMQKFWSCALGYHFIYDVKQIAEETTELWGYILIMTSAAEYLIEKIRRSL